MLKLTLKVTLM